MFGKEQYVPVELWAVRTQSLWGPGRQLTEGEGERRGQRRSRCTGSETVMARQRGPAWQCEPTCGQLFHADRIQECVLGSPVTFFHSLLRTGKAPSGLLRARLPGRRPVRGRLWCGVALLLLSELLFRVFQLQMLGKGLDLSLQGPLLCRLQHNPDSNTCLMGQL